MSHINEGFTVGLLPIYPQGTNSTFFTECCTTVICDDEARCPSCNRLVIGHDAESNHERHKVRWQLAYVRPASSKD